MALGYYTPYGCGGAQARVPYVCSNCATRDKGRVRHAIFYDSDKAVADPSSFSQWAALLEAGYADLVLNVLGSYDGGTVSEEDGFGDQEFSNGNTSHVLVIKDPNFYLNKDFYSYIQSTTNKKVAFFSENYIWLPDSPVNISVQFPIDESIRSNNVAVSTIKWADASIPGIYLKPNDLVSQCQIFHS